MNFFAKKVRSIPPPATPTGNSKTVAAWVRDHRTGHLVQVWHNRDDAKSS